MRTMILTTTLSPRPYYNTCAALKCGTHFKSLVFKMGFRWYMRPSTVFLEGGQHRQKLRPGMDKNSTCHSNTYGVRTLKV